jgi:carboxyl-terminal processing protease
MIKAIFSALLGALLWAGVTSPTSAAEEATQPYVVLVGIDKYADPQILPRAHAEADAKALYDLFSSKEHLGEGAKHVKLLLGTPDEKRPSQKATRENILAALEWLGKTPRKDDLVIFAFFGQGAPLGEYGALFAADSTFKDRAKDAVATGDVANALEKLKSQKFVAFVDVNFLGFKVGKESPPDLNLINVFKAFLGHDDEDAKDTPISRIVFFADWTSLRPSLELTDHGLFAKVLIDGLKGKADLEGYEADGVITIGELAKYVNKETRELARTIGKTDEEKDRPPRVLQGQTDDFVIDQNPAVYPRAQERRKKFDKIAADGNLAKELAEEGHYLLSRMPKLEGQQNLRKAYQKLADGTLDLKDFHKEHETIVASMRIAERDANNYAIMVMKAAKRVRQEFVKDVNTGQLVDFAIRGLYRQLNVKIPSSIGDRLPNAKTMKEVDLVRLLTDARLHLGKREDLDKGIDITFSLRPMLGKLDKHTDYIDPETLVRLQQDIQGHFSGIGVQIRVNNVKDKLQVVTPIRGSPAYKAKIYAGDIITEIIREVDSDGKPLETPERISTKGMSTEDAVKKILGKEGTKVKLLIEREGSDKPLEFNLIRGRVELESVVGVKRKADDTWDYVIDPENKICYVRLTAFSHNTHRDLENIMKKLSRAGIKGFVLDLRFNPGGLLDSAVKISDLFIDDGLIVTIRPRNGAETSYVGKSDGSYTQFPMVCLVNGGSASASEIVSAALQDHHRAVIMGTRSYGKGSVQTIHPFDTGGRLKLTTATFWRPSDRNLNRASTTGKDDDEWGVTPDAGFTLKLPVRELNDLAEHQRDKELIRRPDKRSEKVNGSGKAEFRDRQLDMAVEYLRTQIRTSSKAVAGKKAG